MINSSQSRNPATRLRAGWSSALLILSALLLAPLAARAQFTFTTNSGAITITGYNPAVGLNVVIPASTNGYPVTAIGAEAFSSTAITNVTIGTNLTSIGEAAFVDCYGLTSVTIPNSVTNIVGAAFDGCSSLTNIAVNAANPYYASMGGVLLDKSLDTLIEFPGGLAGSYAIPASITSIGDNAFDSCHGLTGVTIPDGVTSIGVEAFEFCFDLTTITIPNNVTTIGDEAFDDCTSLTSVTIGNSVSSIGVGAFFDCTSLTSVTIPNSVTSIGDYAFQGCPGLTSVTIGNSVTSIGAEAFFDCTSLTSVTIPDSVTSISDYAFEDCSRLTNIAVNAANPYYASVGGVLFDKSLDTLLQFPGGLAGSYAIPDSVTSIGDYAFEDCSGLTSVTIPNSVTSIGVEAFENCPGLTSIAIPNNVTSIGDEAFTSCSGLTSITIPNSVTSIGGGAFARCPGLTSVTIPGSVTSIGEAAFRFCSGLTNITFLGNAPLVDGVAGSADSTVFQHDSGTAYYLPGTTGWGSTYGGWLTALWYQPQPQILGSGLSVQNKPFGFTISWATNLSVVVEASTNLINPVWIPVSTNTLVNGTNAFTDPSWTNYPQRFYRVQLLP